MRRVLHHAHSIALLLILFAVGGLGESAAQTADPRFDWFAYEGRDPIFQERTAGADEYHNPILAGFYPDPSIARAGDDYYLVTSSFCYFPGVPVFHSRDLVSWTQIGHVLDRPSQLPIDSLGISRCIFAPTIRYHDGVFYMITTFADGGGNFYVTATDPAGPWSEPVWLPEVDGIDPDLFFDDDGRAYVLNNGPPDEEPRYEGHRALWMQEFDAAAGRTVGPRRLIVNGGVDLTQNPIWIEAPHVFKVKGVYYLIAAEGGTAEQHSEVVFKSDSVWGPYVPAERNPILTQRHLAPERPFPVSTAGHADFVQLPNGDWWAVFLAARPYEGDYYNTGRETFMLPVRWDDGWPMILEGEATVPYVHTRPALPPQPAPALPTSGNFTYRDDFSADTLAHGWTFIRTPRAKWHTLEDGWLTLRARPAHLGRFQQPSFVGRRQQHAHATVATALQYAPQQPGDRAGLVAFQNDDFYLLLGVTRGADGRPVVQLERKAGATPTGEGDVIASAPLPQNPEQIYLKIDADGASYRFSFATAPDAWTVLADEVDGRLLSTRVAGGFVGTMFGLYAFAASP